MPGIMKKMLAALLVCIITLSSTAVVAEENTTIAFDPTDMPEEVVTELADDVANNSAEEGHTEMATPPDEESENAQEPSVEATVEATMKPAVDETPVPEVEVTAESTVEICVVPSLEPSADPTPKISVTPMPDPVPDVVTTPEISTEPTLEPSIEPRIEPSVAPSVEPSAEPSVDPTTEPPVVNPLKVIVLPQWEMDGDVLVIPYTAEDLIFTVGWEFAGTAKEYRIQTAPVPEDENEEEILTDVCTCVETEVVLPVIDYAEGVYTLYITAIRENGEEITGEQRFMLFLKEADIIIDESIPKTPQELADALGITLEDLAEALEMTVEEISMLSENEVQELYAYLQAFVSISTYSSVYSGSDYTRNATLAKKLTEVFNGEAKIFNNDDEKFYVGSYLDVDKLYYFGPNNYYSGKQCLAYAYAVYYYLFDEVPHHSYSEYKYSKRILEDSASASYALFKEAGVGCGACIRTTANPNGGYSNSGHSMILLTYNESNITFLSGNYPKAGEISILTYSWDEFNEKQVSGRGRIIDHIIQPNVTAGTTGTITLSYEDATYKVVKACNLKAEPYTDADNVGRVEKEDTIRVKEVIRNEYNKIWLKTDTNQYIFGGYKYENGKLIEDGTQYVEFVKPYKTVYSSISLPKGNLEYGKSFPIEGKITSYHSIEKVVGEIYCGNELKMSATAPVSSIGTGVQTDFDLYSSKINNDLLFGELENNKNYTINITVYYYCNRRQEIRADLAASSQFTIGKPAETVKPKSVSIEQGDKAKLALGSTLRLTAKLAPENAASDLTWTSGSAKIATVDKATGLVTPKKTGSATITVKTTNGKKDTIKITVFDPKVVTGVELDKSDKQTLGLKETLQLSAKILPETASSKLTWSSSNKRVATVDGNGLVTALKTGTITITVKTENRKTDNVKIQVIDRTIPTGIKIDKSKADKSGTIVMGLGEELALIESVQPETAITEVTWSSSNKKAATVDAGGGVTAKKIGTTTITAWTENKKKDTVKIKVIDRTIPTSVGLDQSGTVVLGLKDTLTLMATVHPDTASGTKLTWSSSNKKVATVDSNGLVTPVKEGTATITVKTANGKRDTVKVKVSDLEKIATVRFEASSMVEVPLNETLQLHAIIEPENAKPEMRWETWNAKIALVDGEGKVTPVSQGETTISVTLTNGKSASVQVKVVEPSIKAVYEGDYENHRYAIYDVGLVWEDAKAYCEKMGGHLVTITSSDEQGFIKQMLSKGTKNSYWLGGYKQSKWQWVTGEPFSYTKWSYSQPDNYTGNETALNIYRVQNPKSFSFVGGWNDLEPNGTCKNEKFFGLTNFGFICEWDTIVG